MPTMGPNLRALVAHKMAADAVPTGGDMTDTLAFIMDPGRLSESARKAHQWALDAIKAVRSAPDFDVQGLVTDEEVAGAIMGRVKEQIAEKKAALLAAEGRKSS